MSEQMSFLVVVPPCPLSGSPATTISDLYQTVVAAAVDQLPKDIKTITWKDGGDEEQNSNRPGLAKPDDVRLFFETVLSRTSTPGARCREVAARAARMNDRMHRGVVAQEGGGASHGVAFASALHTPLLFFLLGRVSVRTTESSDGQGDGSGHSRVMPRVMSRENGRRERERYCAEDMHAAAQQTRVQTAAICIHPAGLHLLGRRLPPAHCRVLPCPVASGRDRTSKYK